MPDGPPGIVAKAGVATSNPAPSAASPVRPASPLLRISSSSQVRRNRLPSHTAQASATIDFASLRTIELRECPIMRTLADELTPCCETHSATKFKMHPLNGQNSFRFARANSTTLLRRRPDQKNAQLLGVFVVGNLRGDLAGVSLHVGRAQRHDRDRKS